LAGTKAVSSRHRRSPLVLGSTTHRGSSRDRSHPGRRRKASKRLCHSSRTSPGAAAVAHLPMGTEGTAGFDPSGTWRSARGTDLYRSLRFSFTGDRGFESRFLQRGVRCEPDFLDHVGVRPVRQQAVPPGAHSCSNSFGLSSRINSSRFSRGMAQRAKRGVVL
jgi:hypothetical protein